MNKFPMHRIRNELLNFVDKYDSQYTECNDHMNNKGLVYHMLTQTI